MFPLALMHVATIRGRYDVDKFRKNRKKVGSLKNGREANKKLAILKDGQKVI